MESAYQDFQDNAHVKRWLANFPRASTRGNYRRTFNRFCGVAGTDPDKLVAKAKKDKEAVHDFLKSIYNKLLESGSSPGDATGVYYNVKSFFQYNGIDLGKTPRGFRGATKYETERVLTQEEVALMVNFAPSIRDKALVTFLAQTGQRVEVAHALQVRHVKSIFDRDKQTGQYVRGPFTVEIPEFLSDNRGQNCNKAGTKYRFALGEDTAGYLRLMIEERQNNREPVDDDTWVFRSYSRRKVIPGTKRESMFRVSRNNKGLPLTVTAMNDSIVAPVAEKCGIQKFVTTGRGKKKREVHPHVFRRYFVHQLRTGGVNDADLLKFLVGHKLAYGGTYDKFTPELIIREYAKAEPFLSVSDPKRSVSPEFVQGQVSKVLEMIGFGPEEIRAYQSGEELTREQITKKVNGSNGNRPKEFKVVTEEELVDCLSDRWEIKTNLPSGKVLLWRDKKVVAVEATVSVPRA